MWLWDAMLGRYKEFRSDEFNEKLDKAKATVDESTKVVQSQASQLHRHRMKERRSGRDRRANG